MSLHPLSATCVLALSSAIVFGGCGKDDDDGGPSAPAPDLDGSNLAEVALFSSACFATVSADFVTDGEAAFSFPASLKVGEKLLVATLSGGSTERDVYRANAGVTGVKSYRVPSASLSVSCAGYVAAVAVLSRVELFSDEARTTSACVLEGGQIIQGGRLGGSGSSSVGGDYDAFAKFTSLPGTSCPTGVNLHYGIAAESNQVGGTTKVEAFQPFLTVYVP